METRLSLDEPSQRAQVLRYDAEPSDARFVL
jgi:hypothetical protein